MIVVEATVNRKLSSLRLLVSATAALTAGACSATHNLGDNPNTGGATNAASGGATNAASGGATSTASGGAPNTATGGSIAQAGAGGTISTSSLASRTLAQCNIPVVGSANEQLIPIPSDLTGPNWGVKADNCQQGGWNLAQCAGQTATFTSFDTGLTNQWGSITAWVVTLGDTVCCVYESENSNPGILAAPCGAGGAPSTGGASSIGGAGGSTATGGSTSGGTSNSSAAGGTSGSGTTGGASTNIASGGTSGGVTSTTSTTPTAGTSGAAGASSTLPTCGASASWWGFINDPPMGRPPFAGEPVNYTGSAVVTSTAATGATQRTLTLTLTGADAGTFQFAFTIASNEVPTLDSLQGRSVQAVLKNRFGGYYAADALTLSDKNGLILSVQWTMDDGSFFASLGDFGISVTQGATACQATDYCDAFVHNIRIVGTTSIDLPVGTNGTFQVGSVTYAAFAVGSTAPSPSLGSLCFDAFPYMSWAIFRSVL